MKEPIYCKACMEEIHLSPIRNMIENRPLLCDKCISSIIKEMEVKNVFGVNVLFLSKYDGIMKQWLMHYKEYGDRELAGCFLYVFLPFLKLRFPRHVFVPLPSSPIRVEKRGFDHLSMMLQESYLDYLQAFGQSKEKEQKNTKGGERFTKKGIYLLSEAGKLEGKRIVLFDDVLTSGATLKESIEVISVVQPRSISGLILMDNYLKAPFKTE